MGRLVLAPFGAPALDALADLAAGVRGDDALAPLTVVVPSGPAGVAVRRGLARRAGTGVANVRVLALPQLAELLATPAEAADHRRPLTPTRTAAAIRAGLADAPPPLDGVAASATVEEALRATFGRLRDATDPELDRLAARGARAAAVVDRYRDHRRRLADRVDRHDLLALAADAVDRGTAPLEEIGPVVLHLPRRLGRGELRLFAALADRDLLSAVLPVTGDPDADQAGARLRQQLEALLGPAPPAPPPTLAPPLVVLAPDPEEEAREAVRHVVAHLESHPDARVAVVSRVASPYRLLLHEQLAAAGLDHHVDLPWTLAQSVPGRVLLGLLALPEHDFRRAEVARWMRSGPLRTDAGAVPASRWDRVARRAGVVGGLTQWRERLDRYRAEEQGRLAEVDADRRPRIERHLAEAARVQAFVADLGRATDPGDARSWHDLVSWAGGLLDRYLARAPAGSPDADDRASVQRALDRLAALDEVEPGPDPVRFRRVLADELAREPRRVGRLGQGVHVGSVADLYGVEVDLVLILGMAEGWCPPRGRDDPLLPDLEVRDAGLTEVLALPERGDERRDYLAARAAAPEVVLSVARADPRGERELQPARWLLDEVSARAGRQVRTDELPVLEARWFRHPASFEDAARTAAAAIEAGERDLAALLASTHSGTAGVARHPVVAADPDLARGLEAVAARRDREYTAWTGRVSADAVPRFGEETMASPTRLERYAACPARYLFGSVLGVAEFDEPVDAEGITPLDRGSMVHQILEEFIGSSGEVGPDRTWDEGDLARLDEIVERVTGDYRARGLTGRDLGFRLEQASVRRWLTGVLERDERERARRGVAPVDTELSFGGDGEPPAAEVTLGDGRRFRFRGTIDRVDRSPTGDRLVVVDYKTGKSATFRDVDRDRLDRGRRLQLPIYADAARRAHPSDSGEPPEVESYYWFVEEAGSKAWRGGPIDDAVQERFAEVVGTIVDGIEAGHFPANPGDDSWYGPENCRYCAYDRICPSSRVDLWERVRTAPELEDYVTLAEGELP